MFFGRRLVVVAGRRILGGAGRRIGFGILGAGRRRILGGGSGSPVSIMEYQNTPQTIIARISIIDPP